MALRPRCLGFALVYRPSRIRVSVGFGNRRASSDLGVSGSEAQAPLNPPQDLEGVSDMSSDDGGARKGYGGAFAFVIRRGMETRLLTAL